MDCFYTYCTFKETENLLYKKMSLCGDKYFLSDDDWWLLLTSPHLSYDKSVHPLTVSLILAQTEKSQCSPVYPSPFILMGMMPVHTHMHTVPEASRKLGSETEIHSLPLLS